MEKKSVKLKTRALGDEFWNELRFVPEKRAQVQTCRQETSTSRLFATPEHPKRTEMNSRDLRRGRSRRRRLSAYPKTIEMKSRRISGWKVEGEISSSNRSQLFNFLLCTFPKRMTEKFEGREFERQTDWYLEVSLIWWMRSRVLSWSRVGEDATCRDTSHVLCRIFRKNQEWHHWAVIGQLLDLLSKLDSDWLTTSNVHKEQREGW